MDVTLLNPIGTTPSIGVSSIFRPSLHPPTPPADALREINIVELGEALAGLGHRVRVVLGSAYLGGGTVELSDDLCVVPVHTVMPIPFHPGLFPMTPELLRHPAIREADVVQSSEFHQPSTFFAAEACLEEAIPLIVWQETFRAMRFPGSLYQRGFEASLGRKVRAAAARCVPRTSKARAYLRRLGVSEAAIPEWVPTGININEFVPRDSSLAPGDFGWGDECEVLLLVGRLDSSKGVDVALRLLRGLLRSRPNVRLLVRGSGPEEDALRGIAEELHVSAAVRFLPKVSRNEMVDLYNLADVVLCTSRNDLLPFSLIEASACGRSIVAMDVGAVTDIVIDGETGHVVPAGNESSLAMAVESLLQDEQQRGTLGHAARERAEKFFDIRGSARSLVEVYQGAAA